MANDDLVRRLRQCTGRDDIEAADMIERQEIELQDQDSTIEEQNDTIERLERDLAEARKDSERLDWMLANGVRIETKTEGPRVGKTRVAWIDNDDGEVRTVYGSPSRAAIDAAKEPKS